MDKINRKIMEIMRGRNGMDELGRVIFAASFLLHLLSFVVKNGSLQFVSLIGYIYTIYRSFSKDIQSRRKENHKYQQFLNLQKMRFEMRKEYRIFKCKGCGRNIRVPKGKGKIEVTCPLCGRREIHRT